MNRDNRNLHFNTPHETYGFYSSLDFSESTLRKLGVMIGLLFLQLQWRHLC